MNIFATYDCPKKSANFMDKKRCIKMILESAQMLSTALRFYNCNDHRLYKTSHLNHPTSIWCRENQSNFMWLINHMQFLCQRYSTLTGKIHASMKLIPVFFELIDYIPEGKRTPFINCASNKSKNICFKHVKDTHLAYRLYLRERWKTDKLKPRWN